ncbi:hypothetical protein KRP22_001900 [Phytophthora ramorum]|nr:Kinesin-related protein 3 [Phytophthora ramorum]
MAIMNGSGSAPSRHEAESVNGGSAYSCFDGVYAGQSTQEEVFEAIGRPFVADLLGGYNCTIIAYGQTGSGKTFTTVGGGTPGTRGLIPRAMESILEGMARIDPTEYDVALTASFVEIYQEKLRDLLLPHSSRHLRLREDKERDVRVEGASEIAISTVAGGMAVLSRGSAQRATGSTLMNADSSRSHSVLILTFTKKHITSGTNVRGKMFIVDLAGSEKVQKTAATGVRMEEAKHINRSLSALGNVINALTDERVKHIPYRDSKLTRLLQASLGGNAKTHLLLTCSASSLHLEETLSTLRFGSRAKNIQNSPHINNENVGAAAEYGELLTTLQTKIENLHSYIRQLEMARCGTCKSRGSTLALDSSPQNSCEAATAMNTKNEIAAPDPATCRDEDPAHDADASILDVEGCDLIADDLMRAEMQSLRKALSSMMRDHEAQERAHTVARTMMKVNEQQLDSRHRSQEQIIQQQELELQDALATIARLEKEMELLGETTRGMSAELHRLRGQQSQQQAGESAEAEILRRHLDASMKLAKQLQSKVTTSRQEQEGVVDLKARLASKEHELSSLRIEVQLLRSKRLPVPVPSPHRAPQTRPVTAVEFKTLAATSSASRGEAKHLNTGVNNIQNWWSGTMDEPLPRNQEESAAVPDKRVRESVLPSPVSKTPGATQTASFDDHASRDLLPPAENSMNRACNSASSMTRPFRARLVGLLNSLEEETTAYRELVVETKERAVSRSGSRTRCQLPCLDLPASSGPPPTAS